MIAAVLLGGSSPARADGPDRLSGFVVEGPGRLLGRVTGTNGKPIAGIDVHVVSGSAVRVATTDRDGRYRVDLPAGASVVVVLREVRVGGQIASVDRDVIAIRETVPPQTLPKPLSDPLVIPPFSEAAIEENAWVRAWLLLDIDVTGAVKRLKLINAPGLDLDQIAVRAGFALRFEPARDGANRPMRSLLLWSFEWPSYWWLMERRRGTRRLPPAVAKVPCRGSGPTRSVYRDCSGPDIGGIVFRPWMTPR
jgi:hypothetical protein